MQVAVLTRTSGRPKYFDECRQSVRDLKKPRGLTLHHIIGYDTPTDTSYIDAATTFDHPDGAIDVTYTIPYPKLTRGKDGSFPFNLYMNELQEEVPEDCWVIYLDDDDHFITVHPLMKIAEHLVDPNQMILWYMRFPHKVIPEPPFFGKAPVICHMASGCFCFHSKWLKHAIWDAERACDFRVAEALYRAIPRKVWLPIILTGLQRKHNDGGVGERDDKI